MQRTICPACGEDTPGTKYCNETCREMNNIIIRTTAVCVASRADVLTGRSL